MSDNSLLWSDVENDDLVTVADQTEKEIYDSLWGDDDGADDLFEAAVKQAEWQHAIDMAVEGVIESGEMDNQWLHTMRKWVHCWQH